MDLKMKTSELIEELQEQLEKHGDLEVRVWADHGQQCMIAYAVGPHWVDDMGETYAEEDLDDYEDELTKVLEIAGG